MSSNLQLYTPAEWHVAQRYWRAQCVQAETDLREAQTNEPGAALTFQSLCLESFFMDVYRQRMTAAEWQSRYPQFALELVSRWRSQATRAAREADESLREAYEASKPPALPRGSEGFQEWRDRLARGSALTENEPVVATPDPTKIIGPDKNPTPPALTDWQKRFEPLRKRLLAVQDMPAETEAQRKAIKAELDSIMAALEKIGVERTGAATITKEALDAEYTRLDTRLAADIARHGELSRQLNAMEGDDDESSD
jgi:hypothetical protein